MRKSRRGQKRPSISREREEAGRRMRQKRCIFSSRGRRALPEELESLEAKEKKGDERRKRKRRVRSSWAEGRLS